MTFGDRLNFAASEANLNLCLCLSSQRRHTSLDEQPSHFLDFEQLEKSYRNHATFEPELHVMNPPNDAARWIKSDQPMTICAGQDAQICN